MTEMEFPLDFDYVKTDCIRNTEITFTVLTDRNGYFSGRPFYFEAADKFYRDLWIAYLSIACGDVLDNMIVPITNSWTRFVRKLRHVYTGRTSQSCIGALVFYLPVYMLRNA